jgi:DNA-binding NarL/FixJ family response regulator
MMAPMPMLVLLHSPLVGPLTWQPAATSLRAAGYHVTVPSLTGVLREVEVVKLVARGLSNGEIAGMLVLAEQTVKTHVGRILAKLNLRDRAQVVVAAYESGLITPGEGT